MFELSIKFNLKWVEENTVKSIAFCFTCYLSSVFKSIQSISLNKIFYWIFLSIHTLYKSISVYIYKSYIIKLIESDIIVQNL